MNYDVWKKLFHEGVVPVSMKGVENFVDEARQTAASSVIIVDER